MSIFKKVIIFCLGCLILTDLSYCAMDETDFEDFEMQDCVFGKLYDGMSIKKQIPQDPHFLAEQVVSWLATPDLKGLKDICRFSMISKVHRDAVKCYFEKNPVIKLEIKPSDFSLKEPSFMEKVRCALSTFDLKSARSSFVKFLDDLESGLKILKQAGVSVKVDLLNPWIDCEEIDYGRFFMPIHGDYEEKQSVNDGWLQLFGRVAMPGRFSLRRWDWRRPYTRKHDEIYGKPLGKCRKGFSLRHIELLGKRKSLKESLIGLSGILFEKETYKKTFWLISEFKELKRLDLAGLECRYSIFGNRCEGLSISDKGWLLRKIRGYMRDLEGLDLSYSFLYPEHANVIAGMKNLRELNLRGTTYLENYCYRVPFNPTHRSHVAELGWGKLHLDRKDVAERDGIFKMFDELENLEFLDISFSPFTEILEDWTCFKILDDPVVPGSFLVCFGGLKKIKILKIEGLVFRAFASYDKRERGSDFFVPVENLKNLEELHLWKGGFFHVDKEAADEIKRNMKKAFPRTKIIYNDFRTFM